MKLKGILGLVLLAAMVAGVAGCARPTPYVYNKDEFNRKRKDFGQDPTDIASVTVCYNKYYTTPDAVRQLAVEECGKFKKQARFREHDHNLCPLSTPVAAVYVCEQAAPGLVR